jgi:hypothetical protein
VEPARPAQIRAASGVLELRIEPEDAVIAIDGERWIPIEHGRVVANLTAGAHRVKVSCRGYASMSFDVTVEADSRRTMTISLAPPT